MTGLVAFITARLDEDQAAAEHAASVAGPDWTWRTEVTLEDEVTDWIITPAGTFMADTMGGSDGDMAAHVARHDPARVLRDVAAGRKLLAEHERIRASYAAYPNAVNAASLAALIYAVGLLAERWDDHADYALALGR